MLAPSQAPFVSTRRIGDATVSIISEGVLHWAPQLRVAEADWRRAMPEAGPDGVLSLGLNVALVQLGDSKILIDPGYGDPSPDSPVEGNVTRSPGLRVAFESLGLRFDRITHVLITHPHHDHIGGLTTVEHGAGKPASHTPATFSIARIGRATPSKYSKSHPLPSILERSMRSVCST